MSLRAIMADAWDSSAGVRCVALCLALVVATLTSGPAAAEKRVALVIGNGAYTDDEDVVVGDGAEGLVLLDHRLIRLASLESAIPAGLVS